MFHAVCAAHFICLFIVRAVVVVVHTKTIKNEKLQ